MKASGVLSIPNVRRIPRRVAVSASSQEMRAACAMAVVAATPNAKKI